MLVRWTDEPVVRLILDGTVVDVRLGNRNLAAGRPWRADGQKVLLAVKAMGGESSDAWRSVLD